jgi:proteasome lid subunit RPN8/RPN11
MLLATLLLLFLSKLLVMAGTVHIPRKIEQRLIEFARRQPKEECCGLLAGRVVAGSVLTGNGFAITNVLPATNAAREPAKAYEIAPRELFDLMKEMRAGGLELLGIYHSHPNGKNEPSPRDIESAYYPEAVHFILSPLPGAPRPIRAFSIRDGRVEELAIEFDP